jgi:large subunit ribosomal protein L29
MSTKNLREKTVEELQGHKTELLKEQFNLRMQKGTGQLTKPHLLTSVRKQIAKVNTIITEKQRKSSN